MVNRCAASSDDDKWCQTMATCGLPVKREVLDLRVGGTELTTHDSRFTTFLSTTGFSRFSISIGSGKMMVEFFSEAISVSV